MSLHDVYLLLGSNLGDRILHIRHGLAGIEESIGKILKISSFYETEPWGNPNQNNYINVAAAIQTSLTPSDLLHELKNLEMKEGRTDAMRYAPRPLDIDILFYDNLKIQTNEMIIPHEKLHLRKFS